jgi:hypothetical protein
MFLVGERMKWKTTSVCCSPLMKDRGVLWKRRDMDTMVEQICSPRG